ncbi:MAG: hypothetical protein JO283_13650 [Bradyrhizobium sp.]|nr:hypothetical protein [Bradyrhizobium sp.]
MPNEPDTVTTPTPISPRLARYLERTTPKGRVIFAIDATASRQPTWDTAAKLQAEMFRAARLTVQLV